MAKVWQILFERSQGFFKEGWTLKALAVNKSINLETTNGLRIDLAQKNCICDVISQAIFLHCDIIKAPSMQTWFVYFFLSVQLI